jgi:hypothetical protein
MITTICNPTGRKTEARRLDVFYNDHAVGREWAGSLFYSYKTLIAVESVNGRWRVPNHWGPTTGRHFNEMGCGSWEQIPMGRLNEKQASVFRAAVS